MLGKLLNKLNDVAGIQRTDSQHLRKISSEALV